MFQRITKFFKTKSASASWAALLDDGRQTAAGIHVSPQAALKCPPVLAGVRVRCETLGVLPLSLYKRLPGGGKEKAVEHRLHKLLHDRPNAWTSATEFIAQLELDGILHGAGYALANRTGKGEIFELLRLDPNSVTVKIDEASKEPTYVVTTTAGQKVYQWQDVLHVPAFAGLAPVKQCAESIGVTMAMERHAARIFANGGRPSGVLKVPKGIGDAALQRLKDSWASAHAGEASGKTALLEEGIDFSPLTFNSVDLQFLELRTFQLSEIARALAVPPVLIADYGRATWGNSEQMAQSFLTFGILPRAKVWQGAIARLLTEKEQKTLFPEFLVDELVKADIAARFEAYAKAIASRVLNPNEVRAKENMAPYTGGEEFLNPNISPAKVAA